MRAIEVIGLTKSYGEIKAVKDFSLSVESGEIVALAGPDGAGKTTLYRSICGLIDFDCGEVRIMGHDLQSEFESIKQVMGYMPETFSLYPDLSVEENLNFFAGIFGVKREELEERKRYLYEFSGLAPFAKRRAQHLSGGMKQKLALCCNLVHQPRVLLLDEPTRGVDPLSRRQFWEILKQLCKGGTAILVATPYMDELRHARRTILMSGGRKLAEGTAEELIASYKGTVFILPWLPPAQTIDKLAKLPNLNFQRIGGALRIRAPQGTSLDDLSGQLLEAGLEPTDLKQVSPDLEDVFVDLISQEPGVSANA